MKSLYLIGGTMGVGKTTVCRILKQQLPDAVFLDGDWCWDADPFVVTEETKAMVLQNICFMLGQFFALFGIPERDLLLGHAGQAVIDDILARLEPDTRNCRVHAISLLADAATVQARLQKDIEGGVRTADVVARSLARLPCYRQLNTPQDRYRRPHARGCCGADRALVSGLPCRKRPHLL